VDDALQSTWTQIRVSNLTNDKTQIDAMKRLFLEHYLPLNDLFLHFSGSTGRSSNACMTKSEFEHLLRHCKLLFPHKHQVCSRCSLLDVSDTTMTLCCVSQDAINRIFQAANADRNDDDNSEALLTRFELFESLLMVAMFKFGRRTLPLCMGCLCMQLHCGLTTKQTTVAQNQASQGSETRQQRHCKRCSRFTCFQLRNSSRMVAFVGR